MRRTVTAAYLAGLLIVLLTGGVAASSGGPMPAESPVEAPLVVGAPTPDTRQPVGTVEQVDTRLGYLDQEQSRTFHYPGAEYVKVHLRQLLLLPGDYLTVTDATGEEVHRYEADSLLGLGERGMWTTSVTGDTAVVTLHRVVEAAPAGLDRLGAVIDQVARGFQPDEPVPVTTPAPAPESICGRDDSRDAACYRSSYPTVYRSTKPVARLLINGTELCTAFRVSASNRLLTNHHCLPDDWSAYGAEVWFNYQCVECDGWAVYRPTKVYVDRIIDSDRTLDYTLFSVDDFAAVERFGYLELADRPVSSGEEIYIPQHPRGLPTQVAMTEARGRACAIVNPSADGYGERTDVTYYCDTDGGSSGSPVLSRRTHQVVALHHFGGCPNAGVRMDLIRQRIARQI
jgi:lysyl endopeptidase